MYKKFPIPKTKFGIAFSYYKTPNFGWMFTIATGFKVQPKRTKEFYFFLRISDFVVRIGYNV